jgi:hypothetical protein
MGQARRYRYIGPVELRSLPGTESVAVGTVADLDRWLAAQSRSEVGEPFTFVVTGDGSLRLAPRRSEHVACAGGRDVLAAGEITFGRGAAGWVVREVSNQSTGYCPDPSSWAAVAAALDRAGISHPPGYTTEIIFRLCAACGERTIVRDGDFTCALCESPLDEAGR